jgi:hypothetical protein
MGQWQAKEGSSLKSNQNYLISGRWFGVVAESSASHHRPFANIFFYYLSYPYKIRNWRPHHQDLQNGFKSKNWYFWSIRTGSLWGGLAFTLLTHLNYLQSGRWCGVLAASYARYHRPFAYIFLANWAIFMRLKIDVRIKMIYKRGLTWKIDTFSRFERCPFEEDWHYLAEFRSLSYKLIIFWAFPLTIDGDRGLASQSSHGLSAGLCGGRGLDRCLPHQGL